MQVWLHLIWFEKQSNPVERAISKRTVVQDKPIVKVLFTSERDRVYEDWLYFINPIVVL